MRLKIEGHGHTFRYESEKEIITIGRSLDNDFVIPLDDFSRKHCQIMKKENSFLIVDLESKNGVILDGRRIPPNQHFPVYRGTQILLANYFELILFEAHV